MKVIARHQENITLNPFEFICELTGEVKQFNSDDEAVQYLNENSDVQRDKQEWDDKGIYIVDYSKYFE